MKTALIMGITGGFGGHVAQELARKGYAIRTLLRNPDRLPQRFLGADVRVGDAANIADVRAAAEGVDVMVYGVNPPKYRWEGVVLPLIENAARVAEENSLTMVFPGNVYVFDPTDGPVFDETAPHNPVSSKGRLRKEMESRLELASTRGAKIIIIRMGDFIGENLPSAWMQYLLTKTRKGYALATAGRSDLVHTWAYLPDVGRTVAELVARQDTLQAFNVFHFEGYRISFDDIARAVAQASGKPVSIRRFPWPVFRILSPFNKMFRGLLEMRYLWRQEVNLDGAKLVKTLGKGVPNTSLAQALLESGLVERESGATQVVHS